MSDKAQQPPKGEPFVWLTREMLRSEAWRSMSGKARKLLDFLLLEHMGHGGRANGRLKAPYRQLVAFGIGKDFVTAAICECERLGLIACHRGGMRVATTYTLTWLPTHDRYPASNEWRTYRNPKIKPLPGPTNKKLPQQSGAGLPQNEGADTRKLPAKQGADHAQNLPQKEGVLYRKDSYQGGCEYSDLSGEEDPHVNQPRAKAEAQLGPRFRLVRK